MTKAMPPTTISCQIGLIGLCSVSAASTTRELTI